MSRITKIISLLIILCLSVTALAACSGNDGDESSKSDVSISEELFSGLPEKDYKGQTVTFLVPGDEYTRYKSVEIMAQETSPDILNENVKRRNDMVESRFNVVIAEERTPKNKMIEIVRTAIVSNLTDYDIVMPYIPDAATLALEDSFLLLNDMEYIDLDKPCWDQNSLNSLSINNKNYFATGDISLLNLACTHAVVFNKDIINNNNLENPYELVDNGEWTIDKLREMAITFTADVDGTEGMSHNDHYGFLINRNFVTSLYVGSGNTITGKKDGDIPYIALLEEKESAFPVFNKIFELVNDPTATGLIDGDSGAFASVAAEGGSIWDAATESVANGNALFRAMAIIDIIDLGEYECNFGILPVPKYSTEQDEYHSFVSTLYATSVAIPKTAADPEMSAIIAQAMCEASTSTTKEAYFEIVLKLRKIQDDESEAMLDKIFNERVYDLGIVFNWGGNASAVGTVMNNVAFSGKQTFVSSLESVEQVVQSDLQKTLDTFK